MVNKRKEAFFKVCPNCKSPDIQLDKSNPLSGAVGLPPFYLCNNCGHTGSNVIEVDESEIGQFENEIRDKIPSKDSAPLVDRSYGEFYVRVIWKISAPFGFIISTFLLSQGYRLIGIIGLLTSTYAIYITYIKKRHLIDPQQPAQ